MLHTTPAVTPAVASSLAEIDALAARLHDRTPPARWEARLRRTARGIVAASSVAIEGFQASASSASAILTGERRPATDDEAVVAAYGRAMDHVVAFSDDPLFKWNHRVLADLHFDLAWPDPSSRPGRLRTGPIGVTGSDGRLAYTAPAAAEAQTLMAELITWLRKGDLDAPVIVRAAMAHLHLVSIHPFADGNGRASRVLQSLVLALGGTLAPELASIEEYLAAHTEQYYAALQEAHGSSYDPSLSAAPWVEFCVEAHLESARSRVRLLDEATHRWSALEALVEARGWPDRLVIALEQALVGTLDRSGYVAETGVSEPTATSDLRRIADAGLVAVQGAGRATRYVPADLLREAIR